MGVQQNTNGTWNTGDTINGNSKTNISLILNDTAGDLASIVDANKIASVNVNLAASSGLNELEFTDVAAVNVTNGTGGSTLTVTNAAQSTVHGMSLAGRAFTETITYASTSGAADVAALSVAGTGTSKTDSVFNVQNSNNIEAVTLATSGTNYVTVNAGTGAAKITVTGSGTNDLTIGSAAATMLLDASATTGDNVLNIGNLLSSSDTILGGSGADELTASVTTAGQLLTTVTGVEAVALDFQAAGIYNAKNTTGITGLELNLSADATVTNLASSVAEILLTETTATVEDVSVTYASGTTSDVDVFVGAEDTTATNVSVDIGDVAINGTSGAVAIISTGEADNAIDALSFDKATTVEVVALDQGLEVGTTTTLSKATNILFDAAGDDLTFTGDVTASVDVETLAFAATGSGNLLDLTGTASAFSGTYSISTIDIVAAEAGSVTVDDLEWNGKNASGTAVNTIMNISSDTGSTVTISDMDSVSNDVTVSELNVSGAGTVVIGGNLAGDVNISTVTSTLTGQLDLDASSTDNAMTVTLGNAVSTTNNIVETGSGADNVTGGSGKDNIETNAGVDIVYAGAGNDTIVGGANVDNLYGEAGNDAFTATVSDFAEGELVDGGAGTDTMTVTFGSDTALTYVGRTVSSLEGLTFADIASGDTVVITQGTGLVTVTGFTDALTPTAATLTLNKYSTNFDAQASASAAAVVAAGDWYHADAGDNDALTYWDEVANSAVTITLVGTDTTIAVVSNNLVLTA